MKHKFLSLFIVILIAILITPTTALAYYDGVSGAVVDSLTFSPWTYGGTVYAYDCGGIGTLLLGSGTIDTTTGAFSFAIIPPTLTTYLCIEIVFDPGSVGTPPNQFNFTQNRAAAETGTYDLGIVYTDTGPNAVELVEFSVTPQSSSNTWLPFVLLIGSVALVSGTVTVIRKRRA